MKQSNLLFYIRYFLITLSFVWMWNLSEQIPHITGRIYLGYGVYELVRAETTYTQGYLLPIKAFCSLVFFTKYSFS